jgi:predicted Zn finger-like uncharacterized protein
MLITCSNCQSKIRVPDSAAGKKGKCPRCGTVIAIPATGEAAEEAPAEAPAEPPPPPPEPVAEAPPAEGPARSPFDFSEPEPSAPPKKTSRKAVVADDEIVEETVEPDEGAPRPRQPAKENTTLSLVSMILGILSLLCSCPSFVSWCAAPLPVVFAVAALVTGFLGMKQGGKGFAIAGMCCGGGGILLTIIMIVANIFLGVALFSFGAAGRH